jgi:hypothetical protein
MDREKENHNTHTPRCDIPAVRWSPVSMVSPSQLFLWRKLPAELHSHCAGEQVVLESGSSMKMSSASISVTFSIA